jgi:hypothetical protein
MQTDFSNVPNLSLDEMLSRVTALEREARQLREDIGKLREGALPRAALAELPCIPEILRITEEMFPGPVSVETTCDPEDPDVKFVVVNVSYHGDVKRAVDKRIEWHQRVSQVQHGVSQMTRLCICPT